MGGTLGDPRRRRFVGPVACRTRPMRAGPECLVASRTTDGRHAGVHRVPDQSSPQSVAAPSCRTSLLSRRKVGTGTARTRAASRSPPATGRKWDPTAQPSRARLPQQRMPGICLALSCRIRSIGTADEHVGVNGDRRGHATPRASTSGRRPTQDSRASGREHAPWRSRTRPSDASPVRSCRLARLTQSSCLFEAKSRIRPTQCWSRRPRGRKSGRQTECMGVSNHGLRRVPGPGGSGAGGRDAPSDGA